MLVVGLMAAIIYVVNRVFTLTHLILGQISLRFRLAGNQCHAVLKVVANFHRRRAEVRKSGFFPNGVGEIQKFGLLVAIIVVAIY